MNPILYIGITQAFFAGLFIAVKKEQSIADRLLTALLFLIAIDMSFSLLRNELSFIQEIPPVLPLAYGPLLYLYVKYQIKDHRHFNYKNLFHFIPFAALFIATLALIDKPILPEKNFFENDKFLPYRITYGITFFSLNTIYAVFSFILVYKHQKNIKNIFSFTSEKITLNWLKLVLFSFLFTYITLYITGAWYIIQNKSFYVDNINPVDFSYIGLTFFAFAFSFFGFKQLAVHTKEEESETDKPKYLSSNLSIEDAKKYKDELNMLMLEKKPYLDEKLSVSELAKSLNISRHHLTQIINEQLGKNFYTYINDFRIEEVKKMLLDKSKENYTILAVAYECGFNSKSTFNTLFKKYTGQTPSEYKKKVQTA